MKLVDILARELKAWPEGVDSVWQSSCDNEIYFDADVPPFYTSLNAEDSGTQGAVITQAKWQAAVDALNAPKVVEWAKGSLPPIGSVVEWGGCTFAAEDPQEKDLHVGDQVTIIAHLKDGGFEIAAFTFNPGIHNPARGSVWVNQGANGCFRPRRTAEQVAAEEREKAINEMVFGVCGCEPDGGNTTAFMICGFIYDAGYRKEQKPCGS